MENKELIMHPDDTNLYNIPDNYIKITYINRNKVFPLYQLYDLSMVL